MWDGNHPLQQVFLTSELLRLEVRGKCILEAKLGLPRTQDEEIKI